MIAVNHSDELMLWISDHCLWHRTPIISVSVSRQSSLANRAPDQCQLLDSDSDSETLNFDFLFSSSAETDNDSDSDSKMLLTQISFWLLILIAFMMFLVAVQVAIWWLPSSCNDGQWAPLLGIASVIRVLIEYVWVKGQSSENSCLISLMGPWH